MLTPMPLMEPMLMMLEGHAAVLPAWRRGRRDCVISKMERTLRAMSLSKAADGYDASGSPHVAPALLMRQCTAEVCAWISLQRRVTSEVLERSAGSEMTWRGVTLERAHQTGGLFTSPPVSRRPHNALRLCAKASQASALRELMMTWSKHEALGGKRSCSYFGAIDSKGFSKESANTTRSTCDDHCSSGNTEKTMKLMLRHFDCHELDEPCASLLRASHEEVALQEPFGSHLRLFYAF